MTGLAESVRFGAAYLAFERCHGTVPAMSPAGGATAPARDLGRFSAHDACRTETAPAAAAF
jgi:hypothetical protein